MSGLGDRPDAEPCCAQLALGWGVHSGLSPIIYFANPARARDHHRTRVRRRQCGAPDHTVRSPDGAFRNAGVFDVATAAGAAELAGCIQRSRATQGTNRASPRGAGGVAMFALTPRRCWRWVLALVSAAAVLFVLGRHDARAMSGVFRCGSAIR